MNLESRHFDAPLGYHLPVLPVSFSLHRFVLCARLQYHASNFMQYKPRKNGFTGRIRKKTEGLRITLLLVLGPLLNTFLAPLENARKYFGRQVFDFGSAMWLFNDSLKLGVRRDDR